MFGFVYLGVSLVSHIGYKVKEFVHDTLAPVNRRTNTYIGYDGRRHLAHSKKIVSVMRDSNGDVIIYDKPGHVYRNISEEERQAKITDLKKNGTTIRALRTGQTRTVTFRNLVLNHDEQQRAMIYRDIDTGMEYVCVNCRVALGETKEFYALVSNPYKIVGISDWQRKLEMISKDNHKPNWIDDPGKEREFVRSYNNKPLPPAGIIELLRR